MNAFTPLSSGVKHKAMKSTGTFHHKNLLIL